MSLPPDDRTRPLGQPLQPLPPDPVVAAEDPAWHALVLDRLDSLRTAVAIVGVIAVAALVLSIWTFLRERDDRDRLRGGTQAAAIANLRDRVDSLASRVNSRATTTSVGDLRKQVDNRLNGLSKSSKDAQARASVTKLQTSVDDLSKAVTKLDQRVAKLESQTSPTPTPTPSPTP